MRFSKRTEWNTEESALARAHRERVAAGLPVADLTASNPTRCGFDYGATLLDALEDDRAQDYDPHPLGLRSAREAVCKYYADHSVYGEPEQVVLTTSTSEAYSYLFRLLCDPGTEILAPQPGYPLFDFLAVLDDVRLKNVPLVYDHGWQIDAEGFRRAITAETRAIMLVHPNNPTGHFTKPWEADVLAGLCREFELSLIVDEVFLDYPMLDGAEGSFARGLEGVPVYVVSGLSKIVGLPQMKAAWVIATGPQRSAAMERLEVIADTFQLEGVLAVEMFCTTDGKLLVNELAPRPHNSYHASVRACVTGQFEQLVRAVCDLPLGNVDIVQPAAIANLLGDLWLNADGSVREPKFDRALAVPGVRLHLYEKHKPRKGRKMGHLSAVGATPDEAVALVQRAKALL